MSEPVVKENATVTNASITEAGNPQANETAERPPTPVKQLANFLRTVAEVIGIDHFLRVTSKRESLDDAANAQNVQHDQLAQLRAEQAALHPSQVPEKTAA